MENSTYSQHVARSSWHVIYTRPKWEKKVDEALKNGGLESFCPLIKTRRRWTDRQKEIEVPLFNSYVFVKANLKQEITVKKTTGVMNFVYHCGRPATMRDIEIDKIKYFIQNYGSIEVENIKSIREGDKVKIVDGTLYNQEGKVLKVEGKNILMALETLGCVIITRLPIENINLVDKAL